MWYFVKKQKNTRQKCGWDCNNRRSACHAYHRFIFNSNHILFSLFDFLLQVYLLTFPPCIRLQQHSRLQPGTQINWWQVWQVERQLFQSHPHFWHVFFRFLTKYQVNENLFEHRINRKKNNILCDFIYLNILEKFEMDEHKKNSKRMPQSLPTWDIKKHTKRMRRMWQICDPWPEFSRLSFRETLSRFRFLDLLFGANRVKWAVFLRRWQ